jgi:hypothetical protein
MGPFNILLLIIAVLLLFSAGYSFYHSRKLINENPFNNKNLLAEGLNKPTIWLYYDNSDVNTRYWADFGAHSSRALNIPFLNLCFESIVNKNKGKYQIRIISGLSGLADLLGLESIPPVLQNPISPVNDAEMNWIRASILAKFGGLFLSPYTVALNGFGDLPKDKVVFFGTDMNETFTGPNGTVVPGNYAVWSPYPSHPMWNEWEAVTRARLVEKRGGAQIRNDFSWDFVRFSSEYMSYGIQVDPHVELSRKQNGKRIQLEDLLASVDGRPTFEVIHYQVYVPFMWKELRDREMFGWFLRMSEMQIMESDLAIKYLLNH